MSVHFSSAVWKLRGIDAPSKLILLKLADHTRDNGESWPSLQTITDETGLSRATVCRKLLALEIAGIIQRCSGGPGFATCYLLRSLIPEAKESKAKAVSRRDQGSLSLQPLVVSQSNGHSLPMRHEPSLNHQEEPSKEPASASHPLVDEWNSHKMLPAVRAVTPSRLNTIRVRLKNEFFSENWRPALGKLLKSPFCLGTNDRGWRADIDWFLKPDTVAKIMEGKYDDRGANGAESPQDQSEAGTGPPCPDWRERALRLTGKPHTMSWVSHEKADITLRERLLEDMKCG